MLVLAADYSIPMALVDLIPCICFLIASIYLLRGLYNKMSKGAFALLSAGMIDVITAGFLKAIYKLLYAAGACDFYSFTVLFFPIEALGFLLAGIAVVAMFFFPQGKGKVYSVVPLSLLASVLAVITADEGGPAIEKGTMIFVVVMVVGLAALDIGLCVLSARMKKPWLIALFAASCVFSLMMGYLSSKSFDQAYMNWVAELVNTIGQASLMVGAILLHKYGVEDFVLVTKASQKEESKAE